MAPAPIPVLDGHNDVLLVLEEAERRGEPLSFTAGDERLEVDGPAARAGGLAGGFFACFCPAALGEPAVPADEIVPVGAGWEIPYADPVPAAAARETALHLAARLLRLERSGALRVARTPDDLEAALAGGPLAAILHLEGAEAVDPDTLVELEVLQAAGLRSLGPVWSRPNAFGHGVRFRYPGTPDEGPGLSRAGERLVRRCHELGVLVDLAHLNAAGFWDVARIDGAPLVASHTACHALCPTARNLTDDQLDAIGAAGGIVGVIANTADLVGDRSGGEGAGLADVVRHAEHVAARIGVAHVGLGSDWNGARPPRGLERCDRLPDLLAALREAGWSEADVRAFAHGNWLRVLRETWR
jgi:membrane dipeptidase